MSTPHYIVIQFDRNEDFPDTDVVGVFHDKKNAEKFVLEMINKRQFKRTGDTYIVTDHQYGFRIESHDEGDNDGDSPVNKEFIQKSIDSELGRKTAYWERNQLVAHLSKLYPSYLAKHPKDSEGYDPNFENIVFINTICGQCSWHIPNDELKYFEHLKFKDNDWDGHTHEVKYQRLRETEVHINSDNPFLCVKCKHWVRQAPSGFFICKRSYGKEGIHAPTSPVHKLDTCIAFEEYKGKYETFIYTKLD